MRVALEGFFLAPFFLALLGFFVPKGWKRGGAIVGSLALFFASFWVQESASAFFPIPLQADPLAKLFIWLTAFLQVATVVVSPVSLFPSLQYALLFLVQGFLFGLFLTENLLWFFFFWEAVLIPVYLGVAIFGEQEKRGALYPWILYVAFGSVALFVALAAVYEQFGSFHFSSWLPGQSVPLWVGGAFILAFAVKTPLFPFHSWLPKSYLAAPLPFRLLLVALLSKIGIFGMLRLFPLVQECILAFQGPLLGMSLLGAVYAGLVAWGAPRVDLLLVYASLSHVHLLLAGLFVGGDMAWAGVLLQIVQHGLTLFALFLLLDWLEKKSGSLDWRDVGGIVATAPRLTWWTLAFLLSLMAVPGLGSFVGEWLIVVGLFQHSWIASLVALAAWLLSAVYAMQWMERVYFGPSSFRANSSREWAVEDLNRAQVTCLVPLFLLLLYFGVYPGRFFQQLTPFLLGGR